MTSALNCVLELSLVLCASAGDSAGKDLSSLADELLELCAVLVIDVFNLILAEDADLLSLTRSLTSRTNICCFLIFHVGKTNLS